MKSRALLLSFCLVFSGFFMIATTAHAQSIDSFSLTSSPEYPKEFEETTLSIDSFSTDLDRSRITWKENGVVVANEIGLKEKSFIAPKNGGVKKITIEVLTLSGFKLIKDYSLAPQAVDVLWEAVDSYVPPFYRGKALPAGEAIVRVVAIPNFTSGGVLLDRAQTVYNWTENNTRADESSGFSKSSYTFRLNPLKSTNTIKVVAGTLSFSSQVQQSVDIVPFAPQILIYESSPLLGTLYSRAFQNGLRLITDEVTLVAEPYFFSGASNIKKGINYTWSLNGSLIDTPSDPARITLRKPDGKGRTDISLRISHPSKILQEAAKSISILYGQ